MILILIIFLLTIVQQRLTVLYVQPMEVKYQT